jgi:hypothetical protein
MVIEALLAFGIITIATVNAPVETKAPQEIKSVSTTIDANKAAKPKAKLKKKKVTEKVNADPAKQQPTKELAKKEIVKSEPIKSEPTNLSSPVQKSNQSNLLYYILGFLTLGATAAYFYFRKKSQTTDAKIYTSDELKQSLQQDSDKFKYQPPEQKTIIEPQSQTSSSDQTPADPKPDDEGKKS